LHILTCFRASYAEKGYYLRVKGLLLIGDIITTYGQKGYYLLVICSFAVQIFTYRCFWGDICAL